MGENSIGSCRAACGLCKPCNDGDVPCMNANREKAGYLDPSGDMKALFGKQM